MSEFEGNQRAFEREVRIWSLIPSLAGGLDADGAAFPWATANQIAEAMIDAEDSE